VTLTEGAGIKKVPAAKGTGENGTYCAEILRLSSQNDIATQSPRERSNWVTDTEHET